MLTCYCAVEHNSFITQSGFELLASGSVFEQTDSENRAQPQYLDSCQLCDVITVSLLATSVFEVPPGTSADCQLLNTVYIHDKLVFSEAFVFMVGEGVCWSTLPRFCVRRWNWSEFVSFRWIYTLLWNLTEQNHPDASEVALRKSRVRRAESDEDDCHVTDVII